MSRAINLPSQSVKLTNVAIVRLTIQNKRFEIACYKNKVLDYRNGLETDLSEVLQTSNIHIFTNVTKGQFASSTDCIAAFGPVKGKSQDDMAIHILLHGKSIQVSEMERQQLYDTTLLQIATHIASTCINPNTGIPYTTSQIKHALTSSSSSSTIDASSRPNQNQSHDNTKKKSKKSSKKPNSNSSATTATSSSMNGNLNETYQHFVIQPHKPMKQQYLQAIKYLQYNHILPIARASMELIWHYPTQYDPTVVQILQDLHVPISSDTTPDPTNTTTTTGTSTTTATTLNESILVQQYPQSSVADAMASLAIQEGDESTTTTATNKAPTATSISTKEVMMSRTMIVDPSLYRILQEYTPMNESNANNVNKVVVPNSQIEILRQQVFQKPQPPPQPPTSTQPQIQQESISTSNNSQKQIISTADDGDESNDDYNDEDSDTDYERRSTRRNHHQQLLFDNDDSDDEVDNDEADPTLNIDNTAENEVDMDVDDVEEDSDDQQQEQHRGRRNKKNNDKKKKKKHLQLVQSQMAVNTDKDAAQPTETTQVKSKSGHGKKSQKNLQHSRNDDERNGQIDETTTSSTLESFGNQNHDYNTGTGTSTTEKPLYTCNTCIGIENAFHTTAEYRAHYRSDWHRYNQKLKSCHATPISYSEFITCDAQSFFNTSNDDF